MLGQKICNFPAREVVYNILGRIILPFANLRLSYIFGTIIFLTSNNKKEDS
jgi:hypothetical protein